MKFRKTLPSIMLCGVLSLGAGSMTACTEPVDPNKALLEAYSAYTAVTDDSVELTFEQWLEKIKAPLQKSDDDIRIAYNTYSSAMTTAEKTPLSYEDWVSYIQSVPVEGDRDLKVAYNEYSLAMATAGITPLSYTSWVAEIEKIDPTKTLDAAYVAYKADCQSLGKIPLPKNQWEAKIKAYIAPAVDPDQNLKAAYNTYSTAMVLAGKVALSYDNWVTEIKKASADPIDPNQNLNAAYVAYKADCQSLGKTPLSKEEWEEAIKKVLADPDTTIKLAYSEYTLNMATAQKDALSYTDWVFSIKQVPVSFDEGLQNAYDEYSLAMTTAGKDPLTIENWLVEIKKVPADPVNPNEELFSAYETYKTNMQEAGKVALSYENWVTEIKKASADPVDPNQNLLAAYNSYVSTMNGLQKEVLTLSQWKEYIVQDSTPVDPDKALNDAYSAYEDAMTLAGKTPLSKTEWLVEIKKATADPVDPELMLKNTYEQYKANNSGVAMSYEDWKAYISDKNPLTLAYNDYVSAMNTANVTPESYDAWFERIKGVHGPITSEEDVINKLYTEYYNNGGALLEDEWKSVISNPNLSEPSGDDTSSNSIDTYYENYKANGGSLSPIDAWLAKIIDSTLGSTSTGSATAPIKTILSDAYDAYVAVATLPCDYDTFVSYLFEKVPTAVSYTVNADGTVTCKKANSTSTTKVTLPSKYVIKAVDENGKPLAGVYAGLSYTDEDYAPYEPVYGKTDENGECVLLLDLDLAYTSYKAIHTDNGTTALTKAKWTTFIKTVTFKAQLSSYAANEGFTLIPKGYVLDLGVDELFGWTLNSIPFENGEATLTFDERKSDYNTSTPTNLRYSRYWNSATNQIVTNSKFISLSLEAGVYQYITFNPYVSPSYVEEDDNANNVNEENAKNAAKGVYAISIMSDSNPVMYQYSNTVQSNEDGILTAVKYVTGSAPSGTDESELYKYTGTNSINVHLNTEQLGGTQTFGIVCEEDCVVIVQVERIGEANERVIEEIDYTPATVNQASTESGTPTEIPVDGTAIPVYNEEDGYYHLGTKTGKIVYIDLASKMARVNSEYAIKDYPTIVRPGGTSSVGDSIFTFAVRNDNEYINSYKTTRHIFGGLVKAYAKKANADGLYPVTQDIYEFIDFFKSNCISYSETPAQYAWLLPCKYYA